MASFERTREAAREMRETASENAEEIRWDLRSFAQSVAQRAGLVEDDAKRLVNDVTDYAQEYSELIKDDVRAEVKTTVRNLAMTMGAMFVAAVGFLLLNMGVIWSIADAGANVGVWFIVFGVGWILVGAILGAIAYSTQKDVTEKTMNKLKEDAKLPPKHMKNVYRQYQESRHGSETSH
jgi:uncharacterized membrane protein YqjE